MPESGVALQVTIILLLILMNGVFAMSEIAVISSRRARLKVRSNRGDARARRALELARHPDRFLSTVQVGITLVGILAGAYGGATLADGAADALAARVPALARYSDEIALGLVVAAITYLSLVLGELVPKRIGLTHPERIAAFIARPMQALSTLSAPVVRLLSLSTDAVVRVLGVRKGTEPPITEEEIGVLLDAGAEAGVFEEEERELVGRVFWLADQRVRTLMTPRHRIKWLDVHDDPGAWRGALAEHRHARFPLCDGSLDRILGIVHVADVLAKALAGEPFDPRAVMREPRYVPASMRALRLLELFRETGVHLAVVVDEYGGTEGLITLNDVLEEISGDLGREGEPGIVERDDGSWLVDAALAMEDLWEALDVDEREDAHRREYQTLGGFLMHRFGRLPVTGAFHAELGYRFEVVDMDRNRVDKVLVTREGASPRAGSDVRRP